MKSNSPKPGARLTSAEEAVSAADEAAELCDDDKYGEALEAFAHVLKYQSANETECDDLGLTRGHLLSNMAICCQHIGDWARMKKLTAELVEEGHPDGLCLHAVALHHGGNLDEALETISRAIDAAPNDPDCHQERAGILLARGDVDGAMNAFGMAVDIGADAEELLADDDLAALKTDPRVRELTQPRKPSKRALALPLFARLQAWSELFAKRGDLQFLDGKSEPVRAASAVQLTPGPAPASAAKAYPADAKRFADKAKRFAFAYRGKNDASVEGHLFLSLEGERAEVTLDDDPEAFFLEHDELGTGIATFSVRSRGRAPSILWSVEDRQTFASLEEYLTEGARRAFAYGGREPFGCWQQRPRATPLARMSVPRWTTDEALVRALTARGAKPDVAEELVNWLGKDVVLLLPREEQ